MAAKKKSKKADKVLPLRSAYAEAKKTITELEGFRATLISALEERERQLSIKDIAIIDLRGQRDEIARRSDEKSRLYETRIAKLNEEHDKTVRSFQLRKEAPFTRSSLEGMNLVQIRSLAEEAINECRRRDMVEAEGLAHKHQKFAVQTDLETLEGLARTYANEAAAKKRQLDAEEAARKRAAAPKPIYEALKPAPVKSEFGLFYNKPHQEYLPVCWCGKVLTRGQCPEHTQHWTGSERCTCGRAFFFCKEEFNAGHNHNGHAPTLVPDAGVKDSRR